MKLIILFFSLSLFLPTLHAFKIYCCASSLNETNLCYKMDMDMSDVIYYVGGCAEDEYCSEDSEVGYCTKLPVKREDGESCSANSDCRSSLYRKELSQDARTESHAKDTRTAEIVHSAMMRSKYAKLYIKKVIYAKVTMNAGLI